MGQEESKLKKLTGLFLLISIFVFAVLVNSCTGKHSTKMVHINGGTFLMGSPGDEYDRDFDETQNEITVSSFLIGMYQVTQKEYRSLMKKNPSHFKGDNLPVDSANWFNAIEFCNRLSKRDGLEPAYRYDELNVIWDRNANGYRLPTEAEWEYACRAGTTSPFSTGDNITSDQANFNGDFPYVNEGHLVYLETTTAVGSYPPNPWGIYDMHGNVFEWCWDWHDYYVHRQYFNPVGPDSGRNRVIRGGSWTNGGYVLRSAYRGIYIPSSSNERIGFRVARNAP